MASGATMIRRYDLLSIKGEGWAHIVIDTEIGFFAAVSDFGNYAFAWGDESRTAPERPRERLSHGRRLRSGLGSCNGKGKKCLNNFNMCLMGSAATANDAVCLIHRGQRTRPALKKVTLWRCGALAMRSH
jgi:hypothetical protein